MRSSPAPRRAAAERDAIGAALDRLVAAARAAWPDLAASGEGFARHLASHLPAGQPAGAWLDSIRAADGWLAFACLSGVDGAVATFEATFAATIAQALATQRLGDAQAADVAQAVREKLFVAPPGVTAKIGDYAGRGALGGWLRAVVVRAAVDHLRREARRCRAAATSAPPGPSPTPRWVISSTATARSSMRRASRDALVALGAPERNLLRLHFVDGLSLEQVADLLHVHRATAARRLAAARAAIFGEMRRRIQEQLAIDDDEFHSLAGLVQSQLDA